MRIIFWLAVFLSCFISAHGQNLIPNPSFEDTVQLNFGLTFPRNWNTPAGAGVEHYTPYTSQLWTAPNSFMGFQIAKSGDSYIGLNIYSLNNSNVKRLRDYIQTKFNRKLIKDSTYCLSLNVNLPDSIKFASRNQLGVYFSTTEINVNTDFELPYSPQIIVSPNKYITDKLGWLKYEFEYTAQGGERYLVIGNFNDTMQIDTMYLGGGSDPSYYATYYFIDDVWLSNCDSIVGLIEHNFQEQIKSYPNPFSEHLWLSYQGSQQLTIRLYNAVGQQFACEVEPTAKGYRLATAHLPKGMYWIEVITAKGRISRKVIKQ